MRTVEYYNAVECEPILTRLRDLAPIDVAFAARVDQTHGRFVLDRFNGVRSNGLQGISSSRGEGLGGRCIDAGRPIFVRDYVRAHDITHRYDKQVAQEGLRSVFAIPVASAGVITDIVYGASRSDGMLSDRVVGDAVHLVKRLGARATRIRSRSDTSLQPADSPDGTTIRAVASELVALARTTSDVEVASTLLSLSGRLAGASVAENLPGAETVGQSNLTPRELDVVYLVSRGCGNGEIAQRLGLTVHTAKSYLKSAMAKLDCRTRGEAAHNARQRGLISDVI